MITNVVKNVTCEANKSQWTKGVEISLVERAKELKMVQVYFSRGIANQVQLQIRKGGAILIPDQSTFQSNPKPTYGDYITGDGVRFYFPMEAELKKSETLEIYYRNLDATNTHDVMVIFELHGLKLSQSRTRSGYPDKD